MNLQKYKIAVEFLDNVVPLTQQINLLREMSLMREDVERFTRAFGDGVLGAVESARVSLTIDSPEWHDGPWFIFHILIAYRRGSSEAALEYFTVTFTTTDKQVVKNALAFIKANVGILMERAKRFAQLSEKADSVTIRVGGAEPTAQSSTVYYRLPTRVEPSKEYATLDSAFNANLS